MNDKSTIPTRPTRPASASTSPLADQAQAAPATPTEVLDLGPGQAQRVPFGSQVKKLAAEQRPGFVRRWFRDDPGRIDRAKRAGYVHVDDDAGKPVSIIGGVAERGGGLALYLMEIPRELYDADFAAKQAALDKVDQTIYRGTMNQQPGDERYVPRDGIKMSVQRGGTLQKIASGG